MPKLLKLSCKSLNNNIYFCDIINYLTIKILQAIVFTLSDSCQCGADEQPNETTTAASVRRSFMNLRESR